MTSRIGIEALDTRPFTYQHNRRAAPFDRLMSRRSQGSAERRSPWAAIETAEGEETFDTWGEPSDRNSGLLRLLLAAATAVVALAASVLLLV